MVKNVYQVELWYKPDVYSGTRCVIISEIIGTALRWSANNWKIWSLMYTRSSSGPNQMSDQEPGVWWFQGLLVPHCADQQRSGKRSLMYTRSSSGPNQMSDQEPGVWWFQGLLVRLCADQIIPGKWSLMYTRSSSGPNQMSELWLGTRCLMISGIIGTALRWSNNT